MKEAPFFFGAMSVVFLLLGFIACVRPDPVRRAFQAGQPWAWVRRAYDGQHVNTLIRVFGLAFVVAGALVGYQTLAATLN
jgi:uncharacterized protein YjeT (DUF2065 family)